jgi:hypothetical protein
MSIDTTNYGDFIVTLGPADVETPQVLEVRMDPAINGGADVLCFYSGVLKFAQKGTSEDHWDRGALYARFPTGSRKWFGQGSIQGGPGWTRFIDGTVTVSLAAIYNAGVANNAGWAVDAAMLEATHLSPAVGGEDHLQLQALLAVRDTDGILYRLSYQITALGNYLPFERPPVRDERPPVRA